MSPLSLLLFVAGGIFLVLAILSLRKPRVNHTSIAGKSLWLPIGTYKQLVNSLESERSNRSYPEHLEFSKKSEASRADNDEPSHEYDEWILDNILEILAADGIEDRDALLFDIGKHIPMAIVLHGAALEARAAALAAAHAVVQEARVKAAAKVLLTEAGYSSAEIQVLLKVFEFRESDTSFSEISSVVSNLSNPQKPNTATAGSPVAGSVELPTAPILHDGELTEKPPRPPVM